MAKTFQIEIVTPEETALSARVSALQAPAWEGYLGVLAGHAPLLTVLRPGVLMVRDEAGQPSFYAVKGGFMEVTPGRVVVLADAVERAQDVDVKAAEKSLADAEKPLETPAVPAGAPAPTDEQRRLARALALEEREDARRWAEARLRAVDRAAEPA